MVRESRLVSLTVFSILASLLVVVAPFSTTKSQASPLVEDFTGSTIANPSSWIESHGANPACLTATTTSNRITLANGTSISGCSASLINSSGSGALRLTSANTGQKGAMLYNSPLPTAAGLDISFMLAQYGGDGADGISFFTKNGTNTDTAIGPAGGSLGYTVSGDPGIKGALFGIGFDAYGNFSSGNNGATGCAINPSFNRNALVIRGGDTSVGEAGTNGFCYLAGKNLSIFSSGNYTRSTAKKYVRILIDPSTDASPKIHVYIGATPYSSSYTLETAVTPQFKNAKTFKFGFAASTGGSTNFHEIWGLSIAPAVVAATPNLYVVPTSKNVGEGQTPLYDFKLYTDPANVATLVNQTTLSSYVAPTCTSPYLTSMSASHAPLTISCSGGSASLYNFVTTATATLTILTVPTFSYTTPIRAVVGTALGSITPTVSAGSVTSWSISPTLPTGFLFNTTTGAITGTATQAVASSIYTVTGNNGGVTGNYAISFSAVTAATQTALTITNTTRDTSQKSTIQVTSSQVGNYDKVARLTYAVTRTAGTGICSITSSGVLSASGEATCSVVVTNPGGNIVTGSTYWLPVSSSAVAFDFNPINQPNPIRITNAITTLSTIGGTLTLTAEGGNGISGSGGYGTGLGQYSFATQSSACTISNQTLTAVANGPCLVTATRAPSGEYAVATTQWPTYFYVYQPKSNLPVSPDITITTYRADGVTPVFAKDIKAGDTVTLQTNLTQQGGDQRGIRDLMKFDVYGTGCVYVPATNKLSSPNGISYCTVLAYWDETAPFQYRQSDTKLVTFNATSANPGLSLSYSGTPVAGTALAIKPVGGNRNTISWRVLGTGCLPATGTTPYATSFTLSVSQPTTCSIQGTQQAIGIYDYSQSDALTITFPAVEPDIDLKITTEKSQTANSTVVLTTNELAGGGNGGPITYSVSGANCSPPTFINSKSASFRATNIATCVVTALQQPTGVYRYAQAQAVIQFGSATANSLQFSTSTGTNTGVAGTSFTITASGGNTSTPTVPVVWSFSGEACSTADSHSTNGMTATITSIKASSCTVSASQPGANGYTYVSATQTYNFTPIAATSDLEISYTGTPRVNVPLTLKITNGINPTGNGNPSASWRLFSGVSGCTLGTPRTGPTITLTSSYANQTCVVIASQDPYGNYSFKESRSLAVTFGVAKAPDLVFINSGGNSPTTDQTISLSVPTFPNAGSGNGNPALTYSVSGNGCDYYPATKTLKALSGTTPACTIIVLQQAYGGYDYAQSEARTILFKPASPTAISLSGPGGNSSGVAGSSFTVTASGGNTSTPAVPITWNFVGAACGAPAQSLRDLTFTPQVNGSCTITASQPGANGYAYVSATKTFSFSATSIGIPALTISRSGTPTALTNYSLSINGAGSPPAPTGNGNPVANWSFIGNAGNYCSFVGSANSVATLNVLASQPTTCVIQASQAPYGIYSYTQSQAITLTFVTAAAPPIVLATNTQPVAGDSVVVSIGSGGNGNPTVQYTVIGTDCSASSSGGGSSVTITTTGIAYCSVQALQAAYGAKSYAVSPSTALTFAPQNYSGTVSVTSTTGALPSIPFTLTNNASRSADKVSYVVSGAGCTYNAISKTITTAGGVNTYCSVLPFWAYGSPFNTAYYTPVTLSFALIPQTTAFTISNAITTARVNETITVTTRGGSGGGAIAFTSVSSKGKQLSDTGGSCNIVNNNGTATISSGYATTCSVTATKAAASQYQAAKTQTVLFTFIKP
jgi:hypothetical protein